MFDLNAHGTQLEPCYKKFTEIIEKSNSIKQSKTFRLYISQGDAEVKQHAQLLEHFFNALIFCKKWSIIVKPRSLPGSS